MLLYLSREAQYALTKDVETEAQRGQELAQSHIDAFVWRAPNSDQV